MGRFNFTNFGQIKLDSHYVFFVPVKTTNNSDASRFEVLPEKVGFATTSSLHEAIDKDGEYSDKEFEEVSNFLKNREEHLWR